MARFVILSQLTGRQFWSQAALLPNGLKDSPHKSSMIAERYDQLGPNEVQDRELAFVQSRIERTRIAFDLV